MGMAVDSGPWENRDRLRAWRGDVVGVDLGAWRAVAEYRNKAIWIKYAAMQMDDSRRSVINYDSPSN